jgi:hypothetical protein
MSDFFTPAAAAGFGAGDVSGAAGDLSGLGLGDAANFTGGLDPFSSAFGGGGGGGGFSDPISAMMMGGDPTGSLGATAAMTGDYGTNMPTGPTDPAGGIGGSQGSTLPGGDYGQVPPGTPPMPTNQNLPYEPITGPASTASFAIGANPTVPGPVGMTAQAAVPYTDLGGAPPGSNPIYSPASANAEPGQTTIPGGNYGAVPPNAAAGPGNAGAVPYTNAAPADVSSYNMQSPAVQNELQSIFGPQGASSTVEPTPAMYTSGAAAPNAEVAGPGAPSLPQSTEQYLSTLEAPSQAPDTLQQLYQPQGGATSVPLSPQDAATQAATEPPPVPASPTWRTDTAPPGSSPGTASPNASPNAPPSGPGGFPQGGPASLQRLAQDFFAAMSGSPQAIQRLIQDFFGMMAQYRGGQPGGQPGGNQMQLPMGSQYVGTDSQGYPLVRTPSGQIMRAPYAPPTQFRSPAGVEPSSSPIPPSISGHEGDNIPDDGSRLPPGRVSPGDTQSTDTGEGSGAAAAPNVPPAPDWQTATGQGAPAPGTATVPNLPQPGSGDAAAAAIEQGRFGAHLVPPDAGSRAVSGPRTRGDPRGLVPYIRATAQKYGIDPDVAVRVARSEGLVGFTSGIPGEQSFGAFQLNTQGGLGNVFRRQTGLDPSNPRNERATIDFALKYASQHGWGDFHGAHNTGIGRWQGIRRAGARSDAAPQREGGADWDNVLKEETPEHDRFYQELSNDLRTMSDAQLAQKYKNYETGQPATRAYLEGWANNYGHDQDILRHWKDMGAMMPNADWNKFMREQRPSTNVTGPGNEGGNRWDEFNMPQSVSGSIPGNFGYIYPPGNWPKSSQ